MSEPRPGKGPDGPPVRDASITASARARAIKNTVAEYSLRETSEAGEQRTRAQGAVSQMMAVELGLRLTREALAEDLSNPDLLYQLSHVVSDLTMRLENAGDLLVAEAVRFRPEDGFLLFALAARYQDRRDLPRAEGALRAALDRFLDSEEARNQYMAGFARIHLARVLRDQGNDADARVIYQDVVRQIATLREQGFSAEGLTLALREADPDGGWGRLP